MPEINRETFRKYWVETDIIREYQRMLFTFWDMKLPYIFVGEHPNFKDRVVVKKGVVLVEKPLITVPGQENSGIQFPEGFEHAGSIPPDAICYWRGMGLPYCSITNKLIGEEAIEYGSLQRVLEGYNRKMEQDRDTETGLIKGIVPDISLMRYSIGLAIKSAPGNVQEFMEHLKRQRGEPIRPDERISDEDIRKLFE